MGVFFCAGTNKGVFICTGRDLEVFIGTGTDIGVFCAGMDMGVCFHAGKDMEIFCTGTCIGVFICKRTGTSSVQEEIWGTGHCTGEGIVGWRSSYVAQVRRR